MEGIPMAGPLAGIRIIDISERSPSAAIAGMLLSDLGAEVIRVEPAGGDPIRQLDGSRVWLRGQKSVTVDDERVKDGSWLTLRASADAIINTVQPWTDKPSGLLGGWTEDSGQVLAILTARPQSVEAAQQSAQNAHSGAGPAVYGEIAEAEYGFDYIQDGVREAPLFLGFPHATYGAAWTLTNATLSALYERERGGRGQVLTTSLLDGMAILATHRWNGGPGLSGPAGSGQTRTRIGRMGVNRSIVSLFECSDGLWVQAHTGARGSFDRLAIAMGRPDLLMEESAAQQMTPEMAEDLWTHYIATFKTQPAQHWFDVLAEADVPCMPAFPPGDALWLEQTVANQQVDIAPDSTRQLGKLVKYARTPLEIDRTVASVGQHNGALFAGPLPAHTPVAPTQRAPNGAGRVGPLDGLLVLDFGFYMAGPFSPRNLADLGARVIKFEEMIGDPMRRSTVNGGFLGVQRGKEGLAINLKSDGGRTIAYELVKKADVVHHNQRSAAAKRLGIDYDTLRELNPRIIYCHSSGYGNDGPWAQLPTFEPLHSAATGMLHRTGGRGNPPNHYVTHMDYGCGLTSTAAVLAALVERERTGQGQYLEVPQIGAGLLAMSDVHGKERGKVVETFGLDHDLTGHAPTNAIYRTSDDHVVIACLGDREWRGVERSLGLAAGSLPDFASARREQMETSATAKALASALAKLTTADALRRLAAEGVPCAQPRQFPGSAAVADPLLLDNGIIVREDHPAVGEILEVGHSARFGHATTFHQRPAPELGQHTAQILRELGRTPEQIEALIAEGAVLAHPRLSKVR
ncbi:MAG: CoA transferase [Dehalococcoidia bacterium]|nr:CoA transferase [Dehalococcoidia bacterium]